MRDFSEAGGGGYGVGVLRQLFCFVVIFQRVLRAEKMEAVLKANVGEKWVEPKIRQAAGLCRKGAWGLID